MTLEQLLGCDNRKAEKIRDIFEEVVGESIKTMEMVPTDRKGFVVKVASEGGKLYFLKVTERAFLEEIRCDAIDGEIAYQVVY